MIILFVSSCPEPSTTLLSSLENTREKREEMKEI